MKETDTLGTDGTAVIRRKSRGRPSLLCVLAISAACFRGGSVSFETPFTKLKLDLDPPQDPSGHDEDGDRPPLSS